MATNIPEGYELLAGRGGENARKALRLAQERNVPVESVRSVTEGYLVPLEGTEVVPVGGYLQAPSDADGDADAEFDVDTAKVDALNDYIEREGLDVDTSLNKSDKVAAIKAALEAKGE